MANYFQQWRWKQSVPVVMLFLMFHNSLIWNIALPTFCFWHGALPTIFDWSPVGSPTCACCLDPRLNEWPQWSLHMIPTDTPSLTMPIDRSCLGVPNAIRDEACALVQDRVHRGLTWPPADMMAGKVCWGFIITGVYDYREDQIHR